MGTRLILGFAISFAVLIVAPALLNQQLANEPSPRLGDLFDLLTPFVLIVCYYWLFRSADDWASEPPTGTMTAIFMLGAILFIDGHGIHLSANSISHFVTPGSSAGAITYFYDEVLGHYMWHVGILGIAVVLLWRHYQPSKRGIDLWRLTTRQRTGIAVASLLYGITVALTAIEGQTAVLDLGFAVLITGLFLMAWRRQRHLPGAPVFSFLGLGYLVTLVALLSWLLYWGSFPEFSELGIIQ